jgi:hypothetical protein
MAQRQDAVAVGRVVRVDDGLPLDAHSVFPKARRTGPESPGSSQPTDRSDELSALVRDQPGVEAAARLGTRASVDHDPDPGMRDKEPGRRVARRILGAHTQGHDTHG